MNKFIVSLLLSTFFLSGFSMAPQAVFALDEDEAVLWARAEEEKTVIARRGLIYRDPKLDAYLNGVLRKLLPAENTAGFRPRVIVIRSRHMNAFAMPDGTIYIHSCMLASLDNEAQLAVLLGHEISHALKRHALQHYRNIKGKSSFVSVLAVITAPFGLAGALVGALGAVGTVASVSGYSRDLEREADMEGLALAVKAGYDPAQAVALFNILEAEAIEEERTESFFFGSHPMVMERKENSTAFLLSGVKAGGVVNREAFTAAVREVVFDSAGLELKAGRFKRALTMAEKYRSGGPEDPKGPYVVGEVFRQRGEEGDTERAREQYGKAILLDGSYGEPYKALGLIKLKFKESGARQYFSDYLARSPAAPDREYIEEYLKISD